jgi:hypothetical protein
MAEVEAAVGGVTIVSFPLFLSPSDDLHGPPFQRSSSALTIEYMDSYEENKKRKDGANGVCYMSPF